MRKRIGITVGLVAATVYVVWLTEQRNTFFDSRVYWGAMQFWFRDGGMVYDWMRPGTPYGFTYPPFAGMVMAPMGFVPFGVIPVVATLATVVSTALVVWWLTRDAFGRRGWSGWFPLVVALCLAIAFEPVRETISFGQVNTLLLALVAGDLLRGVAKDRWWGGVGIGLATAIKLTPGVFILYLLVTRRWRAAFTAMGTATGVTLLAAAIFPDQSREFWTAALWDTGRVGEYSYLSNQSLRGLVARLPIDPVAEYVWLALVLAALAFWAWRVQRADIFGGLALTGLLACLISPVTWIHHAVWLLPAIVRCLDAGRPWLGGSAYVVLTSHVTWFWEKRPRPPVELVGSNLYVWFSLAMFALMPPRAPERSPAAASPPRTGT